jgi:hypothetical protein
MEEQTAKVRTEIHISNPGYSQVTVFRDLGDQLSASIKTVDELSDYQLLREKSCTVELQLK